MCALSWVVQHAKQYHFDPKRLVLTGYSSGGHLALTSAMIPPSGEFHRECPDSTTIKVAAVVNWFGITDVAALVRGPNERAWAKNWLAHGSYELAVRISPLTYVRYGGPPVITIHGDADEIVPYTQAVRLHRALDQHKVPNRLVTLHDAHHGGFTPHEFAVAYAAIFDFLRAQGLPTDVRPMPGAPAK
jgi:acetyl esterase/lipase